MKIILLKDVAKIGRKYEVKNVSDGHALNLLIPQGLAISATADALKRIEKEKSVLDAGRKVQEELIAQNLKGLSDTVLTLKVKASDKGHLFAGIRREEIVELVEKQTRLQLDPSFIMLEHPIKEVGEYSIEVKAAGKSTKLKIIIEKM